ncbi:MAG TPA: Lrp/AsnC family transcriptional regulator [Thermomicrobiales bacterium]|jgi:Lrp/AsnC family transcriptional regulator for asnA, asnC and gidA|nr:Lrp/AsnC family transcriptional regulator [Chloroflexota bacterium]HBY44983.1 Lrp/AsnC family transcriptional regulator [Chloroflexota bacterium]HCG28652.1 Lrp/AsnC family transcriptional regulator [Chloroflexota bacterium]HQX64165.1 Lrp/AsnC family transcriptional regulator [Thermomicrobiales bacterium]HRA31233.1 Lrp/AsnC family transcriptional regulator [Thermomicrobiales bacterium]
MSEERTGRAQGRAKQGSSDRRRTAKRRVTDDTTRPRSVIQPDELDRQIISLLREDGRRSNREVARRLDVPEATVRYRVRRLTDSGVLKIAASVDPEHLGYALTSVISVTVEPRSFVEASNAIATMPEVMWLAITTGASDLVLTASFRNQEEMFLFVTDHLAHVPGITRIETSVCMRVVKKSHQWSTDLTSSIVGNGKDDAVAQIPVEDREPVSV